MYKDTHVEKYIRQHMLHGADKAQTADCSYSWQCYDHAICEPGGTHTLPPYQLHSVELIDESHVAALHLGEGVVELLQLLQRLLLGLLVLLLLQVLPGEGEGRGRG